MRACLIGIVVLLAACVPAKKEDAPAAPAATANAIDCTKAASPAETAICADPELIYLDGEIGAAFSAALGRYANAPEADAALRDIQRGFNTVREATVQDPSGSTLLERLDAHRLWVNALQAPREGFIGDWGNLSGEVTITEGPDKSLTLAANAVEPTRASWICDLQGTLAKDGDGLKLVAVAKNSSDLGGWTVRLVREGALLKVIETPPANAKPDEPSVRPYCGMNGGFEGAFLPTDKALYQLP